jgi:vacuolar-type H+-ATPase subunit H
MNEVIARVMEAEAEARRIVDAARTESDRILSAARDEARQLSARIRKDTQTEADRLMEESIGAARQKKQTGLTRYAAELDARLPLAPSTEESAVAAALMCVCYPE